MAGKKANKPRSAEAIRRTADRKVKNAAKNEERHQANLALVTQYGIPPRTESQEVTVVYKVNNKTIEKAKTLTRAVRPSKLVRSARRHGKMAS
jgi:hypothetical protein